MKLNTTPENAAAAEEWHEKNLVKFEHETRSSDQGSREGRDTRDTMLSLIGALRHARAERDALRGGESAITNDVDGWCPMTVWMRVVQGERGMAVQLTISGDQGDWHANAVIHRQEGSDPRHIGDGFARFGDAQAACDDFLKRLLGGKN